MPWRLIRSWSPEPLPEHPEWKKKEHRFASFGDFLKVMRASWRPYLNSPDRIAEAAGAIFADLVSQRVRYVEISFGLGAYHFPVQDVVAAIKEAAPESLAVRVFAGLSRDLDREWILGLARDAVECDTLDGIDLHGDESAGGLEAFAPVYVRARERGMMTKAHAGETGNAALVRRTVEVLGVSRIEHGIGAANDPEVVRFLLDTEVTLDVCPWSNVKLGIVSDLARHPLKALHAAGVRTTVSTDDPTVFGQTLTEELRWLVSEMEMEVEALTAVIRNGFLAALLEERTRNELLEEVALAAR